MSTYTVTDLNTDDTITGDVYTIEPVIRSWFDTTDTDVNAALDTIIDGMNSPIYTPEARDAETFLMVRVDL